MLEIQPWGEKNLDPEFSFDFQDIMPDTEKPSKYSDGNFYGTFPIDMDKLLTYIEPNIMFR